MKKTLILLLLLFIGGNLKAQTIVFDDTLRFNKPVYFSTDMFTDKDSIPFIVNESGILTLNSFINDVSWSLKGKNSLIFNQQIKSSDSIVHIEGTNLRGIRILEKVSIIEPIETGQLVVGYDLNNSFRIRVFSDNTTNFNNLQNKEIRFSAPGYSYEFGTTAFSPNEVSNVFDLGKSNRKWKDVYFAGKLNNNLLTPPASPTATGTKGDIIFADDGNIYLCKETNQWVKFMSYQCNW